MVVDKGENFCEFLSALLYTDVFLLKRVSNVKVKNCRPRVAKSSRLEKKFFSADC